MEEDPQNSPELYPVVDLERSRLKIEDMRTAKECAICALADGVEQSRENRSARVCGRGLKPGALRVLDATHPHERQPLYLGDL